MKNNVRIPSVYIYIRDCSFVIHNLFRANPRVILDIKRKPFSKIRLFSLFDYFENQTRLD